MMRRASTGDATLARGRTEALQLLTSIDVGDWRALSSRAIEPNGYYLPDWELAVNATAPGRTDASALAARNGDKLIGLMPVVPLWRAARTPLPALASAHPYGTLCTPLLDRNEAENAAQRLLEAASASGDRALL